VYGLEKPVCEECVEDLMKEEEDSDEEEYVPDSDEEEESEADDDEDDDEDYDDEEEEEEEEEDEDEDDDEDYDDEEEEEEEADEDEYDEDDEDGVEGAEPLEEAELPFEFGCTGCDYEWRDGWRQGWKAAMKQIKQFASQQRNAGIHPTECANCGSHRGTKRCGGTCNGVVRYCCKGCQTEHWQAGHKFQCGQK
jgi:hypothetical protein